MLENHYQYVLVGGGLASGSAAEAIRKRDPKGSILLVGQEVNQPYHRPPLSKEYLRREKPRAELGVEPADWYTKNQVALSTGRRVARLDAARHSIALDSGDEIAFDKLLIATGAVAKTLDIPGAKLPNVFTVRNLNDVDRLQNAIDKAKADGQKHERGRGIALVIGAGPLGVELAASMTQMGLQVELVCNSAAVWGKFAGEPVGKFVTRYLEHRGVRVSVESRTVRLEGDGRAQRAVLDNGKNIACDLVLQAVGMVPNREILRGTPINAETAILTDDHCRTNVENIYAAGDCAAVFDRLFGKHRIIDHWDNARLTGGIAGENMVGGDVAYDEANYFFSDVFQLSLSAWGEARQVDRRHVRGSMNVEAPEFVEIGVATDGRIAQVLAVGHSQEEELLKGLVKRRVRVEGKEEGIKDPAKPLGELF
jgi:NADPH-dependent 2,4-dienoyl-CoA reductase/sulfur reductase-like enzyme